MKRAVVLLAAVCLLACLAQAQEQEGPPPGLVGVPYFFDFTPDTTGFEDDPTFYYFYSVPGGNLPPGLALVPQGIISGIPTQAGVFQFTLRFTAGFTDPEDPIELNFDIPFFISVTGSVQSGISVAPGGIAVSVLAGSGPQVQALTISNLGTSPQTYTLSTSFQNGSNWLAVPPGTGQLGSFGRDVVPVTLNAAQLSPGTYRATITVNNPGAAPKTIPVTVTVSSATQSIRLSQTGLRFQAVQGGSAPSPETVRVLGVTGPPLTFEAAASTTSGGNWLAVTPGSGAISVNANATNLAPGDYYGQVRITSNGVENSPQTVVVVLNVLPANTRLAPQPSTTGVIFSGRRNAANPLGQTVTLRNIGTAPVDYRAQVFMQNGTGWLTATPVLGTVTSAQPANLQLAVNTANLAAGFYRGEVTLSFPSDDPEAPTLPKVRIAVLLVVLPPAAQSLTSGLRLAEGCTPKVLLPVFTRLGAGFASPAGWPTSVTVSIVDDCGDPMRVGAVQASFSNGDPPLSLLSLGDGSWSATWQPQVVSSSAVITVTATQLTPALTGTGTLGGTLDENPAVPAIDTGGIVSAASFAGFQPVAPGSFISIFGSALSNSLNIAPSVPFGTELGGTSVFLGGRLLPLRFTFDKQVNAIVPYDVPLNTTQQLLITNGTKVSLPQTVVVGATQPGIFVGTGTAGIIAAIKPDGTGVYPLNAANRASAGDVLVMYAAGLGTVDRVVAAGAIPTDVTRTVNPVTMTIGGIAAEVVFSGLTPEFPGVYQVNAFMPTGVTPGVDVPVVLTVAGQSSPPVTIAVQ